MYKLCVFDLDGTLVDTVLDIAFSVNRGLTAMGYPTHPVEKFYRMVGNGSDKLCQRAVPADAPAEDAAKLLALYKAHYIDHLCDRSRPYDGIVEALHRMKEAGVTLAVITNKPHEQTERLLPALFGDDLFAAAIGQSDRFPKKPDPTVFRALLDALGVDTEDTVYVGDSDVDAFFAHNAGVPCIGCAWGFRGEQELAEAGAEFIAHTAEDIADIVLA